MVNMAKSNGGRSCHARRRTTRRTHTHSALRTARVVCCSIQLWFATLPPTIQLCIKRQRSLPFYTTAHARLHGVVPSVCPDNAFTVIERDVARVPRLPAS